jgi:2-hydroxychromene-2-carboxylate isomerase
MKAITLCFDVISPYAYLGFERMPEALRGISHQVAYRPVLFAGMLKHFGQLGPAEIESKKRWTFRQVQWLAQHHGLPMQPPAQHPFNPLALLRLLVAAGDAAGLPLGQCNRVQAESLLRLVWAQGSTDADAAARALASPSASVDAHSASAGALLEAAQTESVKQALVKNTEWAIGVGAFGVPSFVVGDDVFWGADALPMLAEYLSEKPWFASSAFTAPPPAAAVLRPRSAAGAA